MNARHLPITAAALLLSGVAGYQVIRLSSSEGPQSAPQPENLQPENLITPASVPSAFTYNVTFTPAPTGTVDEATGTPIVQLAEFRWAFQTGAVSLHRRDDLTPLPSPLSPPGWTHIITVGAGAGGHVLYLCATGDNANHWRATLNP